VPTTVLLEDIVEALEMQFDESSSYLNLDTGQVETVHDELLRAAEEADDGEEIELPEWQMEELEIARQIVCSDRFVRLPTKFDVHEWAIMRDFSQAMESAQIRVELEYAIHGAGAFRHFKHIVRQHHIEPAWFAFHQARLKRIAVDWCKEHDINWR
jgi:hypothetical protein